MLSHVQCGRVCSSLVVKCTEGATVITLVKHGARVGVCEKAILSLIIGKYLHVVKSCAFVSHAGFLLSNAYVSPRKTAESIAVTRADDFIREPSHSLEDFYEGFPKASLQQHITTDMLLTFVVQEAAVFKVKHCHWVSIKSLIVGLFVGF